MGFNLPDVSKSISDPQVKQFLEKFYETSNHPENHGDFADLFTSDGVYAMNDKRAKGKDEIRALRKAIWSHVPARDHYPIKIYTHGTDQYDLMAHGEVKYNHHHGHATETEWACSCNLVKEGEELKVAYYQIIVVRNNHNSGDS
ncbi:hypothetical protein ACLMJK_001909 [Lecanora helva]